FVSTRPPMDAMERCALVYLLTGDRKYGDEAKRRILHFFSWNPNGSTSLFHNDEPAMWMMMRGVRAYDWIYELFTPDERKHVEAVMRIRAEQFYQRLRRRPFESNPYESHAGRILGFLGEVALAFIHEWEEAPDWLDYVLKIFWCVYPAWAEDDGGWQEGPGYWRAYMSFALHFVVALKQATGVDLTKKPFFRNTPYYKLYTNPPYARHSPFGDGQHAPPGRGAGHVMYHFSTLLRDPYIRWYSDYMKSGPGASILGFVLYDPTVKSKPPTDLPQARLFAGVGLVSMHTNLADGNDDVHFLMRSSPFGAISHGHADQNAFTLEAFGEALAIASGYYPWYGSPHHARWTRQTKAKNCITIDGGIGQTVRKREANGRIVAFVHGRGYDYALGDATPAYEGRLTQFHRHVIHVRPGIFILFDNVSAPKPVTFEWWLHALSQMELNEPQRTVTIRQRKAQLRVQFVEPTELTFKQTDKFDPPPEDNRPNQWHFTASTRRKVADAQFLTVLMPYRTGEEGNLPRVHAIDSEQVAALELIHDDGRDLIAFRREAVKQGGAVRVNDAVSDASAFAIGFDTHGGIKRWLLSGGRRLEWRGKMVVEFQKYALATCVITSEGAVLNISNTGGRMKLCLPSQPRRVVVNGAKVDKPKWRFEDGRLIIQMPAGHADLDIAY
ncbi:MAG TPA: DUF4962 domain-containing protein, partial [Armatimonadetes bacterium]|nr:DUF4962 domain-containing protein [Armatimonadota bacterium]